jgi:Tol biopolymer transport system component
MQKIRKHVKTVKKHAARHKAKLLIITLVFLIGIPVYQTAFARRLPAEVVSVSDTGAFGDGESLAPSVSANGRYVLFQSAAANLVNGASGMHVYLRDRKLETTRLLRIGGGGKVPDGPVSKPTLSRDGEHVLFETNSGNLDPGDTNGQSDVYVYDLKTDTTERVSVGESVSGGTDASFSADGNLVLFAGAQGTYDLYLRDRVAKTTRLLPVKGDFAQIAGEGKYIVFHENGGSNTVNRLELATGAKVPAAAAGEIVYEVQRGRISDDGRYVAFAFNAGIGSGHANGCNRIYRKDMNRGALDIVDVSDRGQDPSGIGSGCNYDFDISGNGMEVVFSSNVSGYVAEAVPAGVNQVYLHKFRSSSTLLVSSAGSVAADAASDSPLIASGGGVVTFVTSASNLVSGVPSGVIQAYARQY